MKLDRSLNTVFQILPKADKAAVMVAVLRTFRSLAASEATIRAFADNPSLATAQAIADEAYDLIEDPTDCDWPAEVGQLGDKIILSPSVSSATIYFDGDAIEVDFGRISGYQLLTVAAAIYAAVGDKVIRVNRVYGVISKMLGPATYWAGQSENDRAMHARHCAELQRIAIEGHLAEIARG